jgi:hypothetical protein
MDYILRTYKEKFHNKIHKTKISESDVLMDAFDITPEEKQENMQYWSRELGMCWQKLVVHCFENHADFQPALKNGRDEPCDLIVGPYAIDTKYRIGSGDSGTQKKFRNNAIWLREKKFIPLLLILRKDNLMNHIKGWEFKTGEESFEFIKEYSGIDLKTYLENSKSSDGPRK